MRRGFCGAVAGILAGAGLALCAASPAFAQGPGSTWATANGTPVTGAKESAAPVDVPSASPLPPPAIADLAPFDCCGDWRPGGWYVGAEYLLWWFKDSPVPVPLLTTTSNLSGTPLAPFGDPQTTVLIGDQGLGGGAHHGARFTAGLWLDDRRQLALEGDYFFLTEKTAMRSAASDGGPNAPVLAVPFFDEDAGAENTFVLASPGAFAGAASLSVRSRLQGAELQGAVAAVNTDRLRVEVLVGGRFADLSERLTFATASAGLSDPNTDLILNTVDQFDTQNTFYGWQVGARAGWALGNFEVNASATLALGDMFERANLNGFAVTNFLNAPAGGPFTGVPTQVVPGAGIFVQPSNLGRFSRDRIAVAPEVRVTLGYRLTGGLRLVAGYDFFYLSDVLRPGNQIDRGINFSQTLQSVIAGNAAATGSRPAATPVGSDFWAQGLHIGLELRY
jgi:hypothetical protein